MRKEESARNLIFQLAISLDVMKRLWRVSKQSSRAPGTIWYPLSCPASYNKLLEIACFRPLKSSKVVHQGIHKIDPDPARLRLLLTEQAVCTSCRWRIPPIRNAVQPDGRVDAPEHRQDANIPLRFSSHGVLPCSS